MPPDSSSFTALNIPPSAVPEWMGSFSLAAPPNTDLWRKPPSRDTSTAPILYTALRNPFVAAEVTVSADWELEWDQGGLVIFAGAPPGRIGGSAAQTGSATGTAAATSTTAGVGAVAAASKWVKVGLEFCNNACHATSVCATADGADWALTALPPHHARRLDLRVKIERIGYALWIWYEDEVSGWKKLREVTWFFWGVEDKAIRVGVYASRPANFGTTQYERRHGGPSVTQRNLCVDFEGLEIF
jgi:regulation of enolase protein 1 (concanavalin A-like superfamily)